MDRFIAVHRPGIESEDAQQKSPGHDDQHQAGE
jgi:hypothetical protein